VDNRINELRKNQNIDLDTIAQKLNVSPRTIQRYETGERTPSIEKLIQLTEIFNCSIDYILKNSNYINNVATNTSLNTNDTTIETFTKRLKMLIVQKGLNKKELSKKTKLSIDLISEYISGKVFPSIEDLKKLALTLDTTINYLVGIKDNASEKTLNDKFIEINIDNKIQKISIEDLKNYLDSNS
jgi:transcriptional regulator with XRE-family HTH domain